MARFVSVGLGALLLVGSSQWALALQAPADDPPPLVPATAAPRSGSKPIEVPPPPPDDPNGAGSVAPYVYTTDQAIQFFKNKVAAHPNDFHSLRYLGDLYDRKAKQSGDIASFALAEQAYREALKQFPGDPKTEAALSGVLCSRHQFVEGLALARKLLTSDPDNIDALATMSDALLEIGQYKEGEETLQRLHKAAPVPEVLARLANLAELKGQTDEAVRLMTEAADRVRKSKKPKADAWYVALLGDFAFNAGRIDDAARFYAAVPEGVDSFHDATYGLGRVAYARGDLAKAIDQLTKAVAIGPDVHMLAMLGDLLVKAGRPNEAKPYYDRIEQVSGDDSERRRALSKFLADHNLEAPRALDLARKDFAERQDIFGSDNLAWCLYRNGRFDDAAKSIDDALRLGTKDANLFYHSGMIALQRGDKAKARDHLQKALAINPKFAVIGSDDARKALDSLQTPATP